MKTILITALATATTFLLGFQLGIYQKHRPEVGDIYAEYTDNRNDDYALTNGFPERQVTVYMVKSITNGTIYFSDYTVCPKAGDQIGLYGPIKNAQRYRTFIPPDSK